MGLVQTRSRDPLSVRVTSSSGLPIPNVNVLFQVGSGDATVETANAATDNNGVAQTFVQFGQHSGPITVTATAPGLDGSPVTFNLISDAAAANELQIVSGANQSSVVGQALPEMVVVKAVDVYDNPVAHVLVQFQALPGSGSVTPDTIRSGNDGTVAATWTLGTVTGTQNLTATAAGLSGPPLSISAEATPDAPATIVAIQGDNQGGAAGAPLPDSLKARLEDQFTNPIPGATISFFVFTGDGVVSPETASTNDEGIASTSLTLGSSPTCEVTATHGSLAPVVFHARAFVPLTLRPPTVSVYGIDNG